MSWCEGEEGSESLTLGGRVCFSMLTEQGAGEEESEGKARRNRGQTVKDPELGVCLGGRGESWQS